MSKKTVTKRHRQSLREIYFHHIIWGVVCIVLLALLLTVWFYNRSLNTRAVVLEERVQALSSLSPTCQSRDSWTEGKIKTFQTVTKDGSRSYDVQLPQQFDKNKYYPLLMYFPGKGMNAQDAERIAGFSTLPTITVFPHPSKNADGIYAWDSAPYAPSTDDVDFTRNIIDDIQGRFCITQSQIYAVGFSNGGGMASLLTCVMPDQFAAIAIVSGAMYYPAGGCTPPKAIPLINIHGDRDSIIPYTGSVARGLPNVDAWVARRAELNGCEPIPSVTYADTLTTITTWQRCKDNTVVQNIRYDGAEHQWFRTAPTTVWDFLTRFSR